MITIDQEADKAATTEGPAIKTEKASQQQTAPSPGLIVVSKMTLVLLVAINLFVVSGALCLYDRYYAQKVVALDVKGYLIQQRDLYLSRKIDAKQFEKNLDALDAAVKRTPKNKIIVMGDAIVRPAEIITP